MVLTALRLIANKSILYALEKQADYRLVIKREEVREGI